jgi:hypothetical protein
LSGTPIDHLAIKFCPTPRYGCKKQRSNQDNKDLETSVALPGFPPGNDLGHRLLLLSVSEADLTIGWLVAIFDLNNLPAA